MEDEAQVHTKRRKIEDKTEDPEDKTKNFKQLQFCVLSIIDETLRSKSEFREIEGQDYYTFDFVCGRVKFRMVINL